MDLKDLFPAVVTFVAVGVLMSFGLSVQSNIRQGQLTNTGGCNATSTTSCGYDYNASTNAMAANTNLSANLPILGTITIAAIVVGVLIRSFTLG
jgi:hypothetical protein